VDQGPQANGMQFDKVLKYIESGKQQGARVEAGGKRSGNNGWYIEPTVFSGVTDDMTIARDEIFGPVQSILKFRDTDEVIRRANETPYGLGAGVWSKDIDTINTVSRGIRAGTVWCNSYYQSDAAMPFGGYKMSGFGRDRGSAALDNYTNTKAVYQPLTNPTWL